MSNSSVSVSARAHFFHERFYRLIMLANLAYFAVMVASGVDWQNPQSSDLLRWGANFAPLTLTGQSWRLVTNMFMHAGVMHLAVNMISLYQLGEHAEWRFGSLRFGVIYWLSGLGGGLLSALWHGYHTVTVAGIGSGGAQVIERLLPAVSVGASGAIMGLAGAIFVADCARRFGPALGTGNDRASGRDMQVIGMVIVVNLAFGFMTAGIDQAAHVGGLLVGLVSSWLLLRRAGSRARQYAVPLVVALLGTLAMGGIAQHLTSPELQAYRQQVDMQGQRAVDGSVTPR